MSLVDSRFKPRHNPKAKLQRRRGKLLSKPFPSLWIGYLEALPFYEGLTDDEKEMLRRILRVIVAEKSWEGCGGLQLNDEIKVTIAAQAALPLLRLEHDHYRRAQSIVVYPSTFMVPNHQSGSGGMVLTSHAAALGLAFHRGPVVLAWDSARHGVKNQVDGRNVVLHEFAHKLDMLDGAADGTPQLGSREQYAAWHRIMTEEYERLVEDAERGRRTLLDTYGATNAAEFFAVATECFFEKPRQMRKRHRELYGLLRSYYRQDPAARASACR